MEKFKGLVVKEVAEEIVYGVEEIALTDLSAGEVVIKVAYSSLNYKDMLAVQKKGGVINRYPMIPGIDLSGEVVASENPQFAPGTQVLVTGFKLGMSHTGGLAEYARVPAEWLVPLPPELSLKNAMILGTAGYTAALSIAALEKNGLHPATDSVILVTGATGGVGSLAMQMLKKAGYKNIHALVRKESQIAVAKKLGADEVFFLENLVPQKKILAKSQYDFILDTVGGEIASSLIPILQYRGSMTLCGNAGGIQLNTTVLPFILRGINLLGIDSVEVPLNERFAVWKKMATDWNVTDTALVEEIPLSAVPETINALKAGQHLGRTIVKL